ncbi:MAG: DUF3089 domain-containing protein [Bacteroidota bacterium]
MKKFILILLLFNNTVNAQTDYSQLENWYYHPDKIINVIGGYNLDIAVVDADLMIDSTISITNNSELNTGVDVFWVHPTQLTSPPSFPTTVPLDSQPYSIISSTILAQGALLAKYGRFYAPRYQQATPASFLSANYSDSTRASSLVIAYNDVKAAFEDYVNNHNNGNKIILAGHSQGSFLLAMLLHDVFDNDPSLRSKLVTASLGGMPYIHAEIGLHVGGQWENIPLCTTMNQCECIHTWRSFKETQIIPNLVTTLPVFNTALVDSGLVYRNVNISDDWFVQDSLYYTSTSSSLRYYITPDASYNLGGGANYIAFDNYYTARFKRTSNTKLVLAVDYNTDLNDQRPNDLLALENSISFLGSGFHSKDYHIYLWALMEQIDAKLDVCSITTNTEYPSKQISDISISPNPNLGNFTVQVNRPILKEEYLFIIDAYGRIIKRLDVDSIIQVELQQAGIYFLITIDGTQKIIIN